MIDLSRRTFVSSSLTAGFALAVQPVRADAIRTDDKGLSTQVVQLKTTNGPMPAFVAMPDGKGPFPLVLVVQEIFGVHEYIKDVCRRFAKLGAMAIAPELFVRHADVSKMSDIQGIIKEVVSKVSDAQVMSDLDAAVAWAMTSGKLKAPSTSEKNKPVAPDPVIGITGFCWGGRITWLYAAHNPRVRAGVAWYGRLTSDVTGNQPKHPLDVAKDLKVPVLGLYGGKDQGIPLEAVEKMKAALRDAKSASDIHVYPEAGHAFHADYRPSYAKDAAEDGWRKLTAWFKKNGVLKA
ncbi:MAG: dienelactone hydrolase family protein [Myxococcales bacterium]|nr:dienelactone hydrolase family protein [Myxococcales bacterium]